MTTIHTIGYFGFLLTYLTYWFQNSYNFWWRPLNEKYEFNFNSMMYVLIVRFENTLSSRRNSAVAPLIATTTNTSEMMNFILSDYRSTYQQLSNKIDPKR